jgi:predicted DNA-binding transcriptional regulator AlpA
MNKNDTQVRWLSPKDFELNYGIKQSTQAKLRMNKTIPFSKIGKFIKYDKLEIDKWFESHWSGNLNSYSCY